jgi:Phage portal protein
MGRQKHKSSNVKHRNRQHKQRYPVTSSHDLELSAEQVALLSSFVSEVDSLRSSYPHVPFDRLDLSEIALKIAQTPQLAYVLDAIKAREDARQAALSDIDTRGAVVGSMPQMANAAAAKWGGSKDDDPIGVTNYKILRKWAEENEWVRAAITIRRGQVEGMHPICIPIDPKKRYDRKIQLKINNLLKRPNERRESWRSLIGPVLEDVLVLDRGAIVKNMTLDRKPVALYFADGATIKIYPGWSGNPKEPRYLYESPDGKEKKPLRNDECIMMVSNSASHRVSLSFVQALQNTIIADIEATATAARLGKLKPPPHAIQVPGATPKQIQEMVSDYDRKIAGRKELFWFGGKEAAHLFPLVFSAKDNQLLEWQVYLARKIAVLAQISPQKLGITMDVNRANGEVQQEIDEDRGLIPLLLLVEEYLNTEVLGDYAPLDELGMPDLDALNLKVIFPEVSDAARKLHAQETINMASKALTSNMPSMTLNMILSMLGEEPVPGGDTFYVGTASGPIKWLSYDEPLETMPQNMPVTPQESDSNATGNEESEEDTTTEDASESSDKGKNDDATKKDYEGYYDGRLPGKTWSPSMNRAAKTASLHNKTQKSANRKKIPDAAKNNTRSPEHIHAETVLSNAVKKLFDDAAKRGDATLQRMEHE